MSTLGRSWKELKRELLQDADFKKAYEELEPEYQVARSLIALRAAKGMTQAQMAARSAVQRPMLSRLESAKEIPTIHTLAKIAAAYDGKIEVRFVDKYNRNVKRVPPIRVGRKYAQVMRERHR